MNQRLLLESKEHMRARGIRSPDEWDAVALTFAEPVKDTSRRRYDRASDERVPVRDLGGNAWMAF